jgi:hypothetical protein
MLFLPSVTKGRDYRDPPRLYRMCHHQSTVTLLRMRTCLKLVAMVGNHIAPKDIQVEVWSSVEVFGSWGRIIN